MSDNEKESTKIDTTETETGATSAQNADWEVVSLTASAYAASPPQQAKPTLDKSGQFVFPPSEHENLPIEQPLVDQSQTETETEIPSKIDEIQTPQENQEDQEDQENQEDQEDQENQEDQEDEGEEEEFVEKERESEEREGGKREKEKEKEKEERDGIEWVKKRVSCFYKHVKEANTYWSVFVAATLVGLVILGHRWQREKSHGSYHVKAGTNTARG